MYTNAGVAADIYKPRISCCWTRLTTRLAVLTKRQGRGCLAFPVTIKVDEAPTEKTHCFSN